jgi:hypothetical protein
MHNSSDSNQPDFWTVRYAAGKAPWDFGGVPSTRFGHLFLLAACTASLWPSYSHLSRVPNLVGRDRSSLATILAGSSLPDKITIWAYRGVLLLPSGFEPPLQRSSSI